MYQAYRDGMAPILKAFSGKFGYDFSVDEVLKSEADHNINRVFTICFDSKQRMKDFFADPEYLSVRTMYFSDSVDGATIISSYEK